jgi:phosphoribosylamine--glycine ligase
LKVLVIGSGGREHTIAWKLSQSPKLSQLLCAPGNAGTAALGENLPISSENIDRLLAAAKSRQVELTVVGPEAPLVNGIVDRFTEVGLAIVGPTGAAAQLEGSKVFTKRFLEKHRIPTGVFQVFGEADAAEQSLNTGEFPFPVVVKADGLAAGKGVFVCCDLTEALGAVDIIMRQRKFGASGDRILIEEFLRGEEASFMVFTDGETILPMAPSQDHKAIFDDDKGPNTGGMGAYSMDGLLPAEMQSKILNEIIEPTVMAMAQDGTPFQGILYAGLMLTSEGPKVLEYNVRFGDPETQAVLPRMKSDLLEVFLSLTRGDLGNQVVEWSSDAAVCIVVAAKGYPGSYEKGFEVSGIAMAEEEPNTVVFHAGTDLRDGTIVSSGGRVLGVTSLSSPLDSAIMKAYEAVNKVYFDGMYYRKDIAAKGLKRA